MTQGFERASNPIDGLVNIYYDQLLQQGRETAQLQPAVYLRGAADGNVTWLEGEQLKGYSIRTVTDQSLFPAFAEELTTLGFSPEMLREGIWCLQEVAHAQSEQTGDWSPHEYPESCTYAYYNGEAWYTVRWRGGPSDDEGSNWQEPVTDLTAAEKDAITRIVKDTNFVLDVAMSLQDKPLDHSAFKYALAEKARISGDENSIQAMSALVNPHGYLPQGLAYCFYPTLYQISPLCSALYRALVGKGQSNSTDFLSVQTLLASPSIISDPTQVFQVREASICPPYEEFQL